MRLRLVGSPYFQKPRSVDQTMGVNLLVKNSKNFFSIGLSLMHAQLHAIQQAMVSLNECISLLEIHCVSF